MVELIWDGKYDEHGKRVAPQRINLPFQTVETVNESAQQRQRMLDLFSAGRDPEWRNRLIWGDNNGAMSKCFKRISISYSPPPLRIVPM